MSPAAKAFEVVTPAPQRIWSELAAADPGAVAEQSPDWVQIMTARGYQDRSRLYEFADGNRFVLPLVGRGGLSQVPLTGFGTGWGMGGAVGPGLVSDHVSAMSSDLATLSALYVHVRPNPSQHGAWRHAETGSARAINKRAHIVDLRGGADETFRRFRRSGRKGVARAERAGVTVTLHTGGDRLDAYYEQLFLGAIDRWAKRQREPLALAQLRAKRRDPISKLRAMAAGLGDRFRLYLASVDGELVAGNVVLWEPNAHATRGAMNYDAAKSTRAAYALDWAAIKDACQAGHRWYHLGETGENRSLAEYKERFGATAIDYAEYRFERVPLLAIDHAARRAVKRAIGFRD